MIKWVFLVFNFFSVMLVNLFFADDIGISVSAPTMVTGGDEFQVTVTLNKGNLESFSRLMQELPAGLKAKSVSSANADFTFKDNKVRLIWLKMPEEGQVSVTYTIQSDQRLKGSFELGGKFSFIQDNERRSVDAEPLIVTINPNPTIDPNLLVDVKDFKDQVIPDLTSGGQLQVACVRERPRISGDPDGGIVVNLLVNKESAEKFAKIEEDIPAGYTALKIDAKGGIFSFKDGRAKFLWMNLPQEAYFIVSYRLVPNAGVVGAPQLKGQFSYVDNEKTKILDIVEKDIQLSSMTGDSVKALIAQILAPKPLGEQLLIAEAEVPAEKPEPEIEKPTTKKKNAWQRMKLSIDKRYLLEPEDGVYYRVQLAAGHNKINIKSYFKKLNVSDEVRIEEHEGWKKYSIGSFNDYKLARDYRVHIWNTTPVGDAFVAAYNSGRRITVQEALMISNQKWYR